MAFTSVHAGKYSIEDKLKTYTIHKLSQPRKSKQHKIQHNKTSLVQSPFTTLGQETRWAYSTTLSSPLGKRIGPIQQPRQGVKQSKRNWSKMVDSPSWPCAVTVVSADAGQWGQLRRRVERMPSCAYRHRACSPSMVEDRCHGDERSSGSGYHPDHPATPRQANSVLWINTPQTRFNNLKTHPLFGQFNSQLRPPLNS